MQPISRKQQLKKMEADWDKRARQNARFYVASEREDWTDEEFFRSGRLTVEEEILTDMTNICQGRDPKQMKVLEIGCGAGRVTSALADVFGEVHAVDFTEHFGQRPSDPAGAAADLEDLHLLGVPALADVGHVVENFLLHGLTAEAQELLVGPLLPLG